MVDIRVDMSLDYPVSIESILSLSFNQDSFKVVFQFILEALRRHESNFKAMKDLPSKLDLELINKSLKEAHFKIGNLENASENQEHLLKTHSETIQKNKQHVEKAEKAIENIEKLLGKQEKILEATKLEINHLADSSEAHGKTLSTHSDEINLLKKILSQVGNNSSGPTFPIEALQDLENRINSVDTKHNSKEESLNARLSDLEAALKILKENIQKNNEDIINLKKLISSFEDRLKAKAEASDLERLKNFRPSGDGQNANMSHYDILIESLQNEIDILKKKVAEIPVLQKNIESLTRRVSDLEEKIKLKMDSSEVLALIGSFKSTDTHSMPTKDPNSAYILKKIAEHDEKIEAIMKLLQKPQSSDAELWNLYNELRLLMDTKANLSDLKNIEERLQEKVIAVCEAMGNKFADRADTKKALKYLESLIREYFEFGSKKPMGEDAMFAKKPLGGWSCASCETNLEKLKGMAASYYSWNKMPYRDPNDRIARAGPGFSRMLATIQPEAIASRVKTANTKVASQIEEEFPPDPRAPQANKKVVRPMSAYHH